MIYFENSRTVDIEDLRRVVDEDGKRIYSERLIQGIESGDLNCLYEIDISDRNNKFFMEPLLFAVKNSEFSTYEVYKYYGEELQEQDLTIATEIVMNEPEILEGTAITENPTLVLYFAEINPEIILYMSDDLKSDGDFIEELCKSGSKEAIMYAVSECDISAVLQYNSELASNPEFMKEAIKEDANLLEYVSEDFKNDSKFMQEVCKENREVITYVAEHTQEFNKEILDEARGTLEEHFITDATNDIEEESQKIEEEEKEIQTDENDSVQTKEIQKRKRGLSSAIRAIKHFQELPEEKKPRAAHKYLIYVKNIPNKYRKMLEQYDQLYIAAQEKEKAKKEKIEKGKITPEDIEKASEGATLSEIQAEPTAIREEITAEREETIPEKNEEEIGE